MFELKDLLFKIVMFLSFSFGIFLVLYSFLNKTKCRKQKILFFILGVLFILNIIGYKFNIISKNNLAVTFSFIAVLTSVCVAIIGKKEDVNKG